MSAPSADGKPIDDYSPQWFMKVHITSFPNGTGGAPKGMSLSAWANLLTRRYPRAMFGQNVYLLADMFNILQRHETSTQSGVSMRLKPSHLAVIGSLTQEEVS